jgi:hypothetical protein
MSISYTGGHWVVPGTYKVRLTAGEESQTQSFNVKKDPRLRDVTREDLMQQFQLVSDIRSVVTDIHNGIRTIRSVRSQLENTAKLARKAGIEGDFQASIDSISEKLTAVEEELFQTRSEVGSDPLNFPPKIDNQFVYLYGHVNGAYGRPTNGSYQRFEDLKVELQPHMDKLKEILETDVAQFNVTLREAGAAVVMVPKY